MRPPELRLGARLLEANLRRPKRPFKLTLALTWKCESRCRTCGIWRKPRIKEWSLDELDRFFFQNPYFNWIDLTGGEPFLRPDIVEICESVVGRCKELVLLHLPTSGQRPQKILAAVQRILDLRPRRLILTVSLDGPRRVHDHMRNRKGSFERALRTLKSLKELQRPRFEVFAGCTISAGNQDYVDELLHVLCSSVPGFGRNDLHLNLAQGSDHYYFAHPRQADPETVCRILDRTGRKLTGVKNPVDWLEWSYQHSLRSWVRNRIQPVPCMSLSTSLFVDAEANAYPCVGWNVQIANLRETGFDLERLWRTDRARKLAAAIMLGRCPGCWTPCEAYQSIAANSLPGSAGLHKMWASRNL